MERLLDVVMLMALNQVMLSDSPSKRRGCPQVHHKSHFKALLTLPALIAPRIRPDHGTDECHAAHARQRDIGRGRRLLVQVKENEAMSRYMLSQPCPGPG